jgi:hypothetical protein
MDVDVHARGGRVLRRICERLGGEEIGRRLDGSREPFDGDAADLERYRRATGGRAERRPEALLGEDRGMQAASKGTDVLECALHFRVGFVEERGAIRIAAASALADELQCKSGREQTLLRAIVQIALQPAPLFVSRSEDARSGGAHLGELYAELRLQARVLERKRRCRGDGVKKDGVLKQRGVVNERGERPAFVLEHADRAAVRRAGLECRTVSRDVPVFGGQ